VQKHIIGTHCSVDSANIMPSKRRMIVKGLY
jgi:hypothetical protein